MTPILIEQRQSFVERDTDDGSWTSANLFVSGIADDPVDPGSEGRVTPERVNLADHPQEGVLDDFFGIVLVARDSYRQAIGSIAIRGDKSLRRRRLLLAQGRQQLLIRIETLLHIHLVRPRQRSARSIYLNASGPDTRPPDRLSSAELDVGSKRLARRERKTQSSCDSYYRCAGLR